MRAALLASLVLGLAARGAMAEPSPCRSGSRPVARAELYFGAGATTSGAWRRFLASVVTPRFPDGLTSLDAMGQWRGPRGVTREATHVLVILYEANATSDARLEAIRQIYKRRFAQSSVLRVDTTACASF